MEYKNWYNANRESRLVYFANYGKERRADMKLKEDYEAWKEEHNANQRNRYKLRTIEKIKKELEELKSNVKYTSLIEEVLQSKKYELWTMANMTALKKILL